MEIHGTCILIDSRLASLEPFTEGGVYLALVLLVSHPEFDVRVAEAVGVHGLEATPFYQADADYASPQLSFPVHVGQTHALILQRANTGKHVC